MSFGPYELVELIGEGGMGQVWHAYHTKKAVDVAVKLLQPEFANSLIARERFILETATLKRLGAPYIIPIHDFGEIDGRLFIEMPLINGIDLGDLLKKNGPLSPARAVELISQIADALDAAHQENVLHRDVKPSNILVIPRDEAGHGGPLRDMTYLIDFGIAQPVDEHGLTQDGTRVPSGTLRYMAPEQFSVEAPTRRVDVCALACVLHECLTGQPARMATDVRMFWAAVYAPPPQPSRIGVGVPVALDAVIARGLDKDPMRRYPTAGALAEAARAALLKPDPTDTTDADTTDTDTKQSTKPRRRLLLGSLVAGVAVAVLLAVATLLPAPATVELSGQPVAAAAGTNGKLYVADQANSRLFVLDAATHQVAGPPLPVGQQPSDVLADPFRDRVYVANRADGSVSQLNTATGATERTIQVGAEPTALAINADGSRLYVANARANSVTTIDTGQGTPLGQPVAVGARPSGLALSPDGGRLYVANADAGTVSVIDTTTGAALPGQIPLGDRPVAIVAVPGATGNTLVYVANQLSGTLSVIEAGSGMVLRRDLSAGAAPTAIATRSDGRRIYVTGGSRTLTTIDPVTNSPVGQPAELGGNPLDVTVTADDQAVAVVGQDPAEVSFHAA